MPFSPSHQVIAGLCFKEVLGAVAKAATPPLYESNLLAKATLGHKYAPVSAQR